jgi:hypothetical protein
MPHEDIYMRPVEVLIIQLACIAFAYHMLAFLDRRRR